MVKVSIVLPAYNCEDFIKESIQSMLDQTFQDFELIIIEDGSTDGTLKQIMTFLPDKRINLLVHGKNRGLSQSLNDGLRCSIGDYIAIQHGDDLSIKTRLEKQVKYLDNHNIHLVSTCTKFVDEKGNVNKKDSWWLKQIKRAPETPEEVADKLLEMNFLVHTSVMFKREVLSVGTYDNEMPPAEDYDFFLRINDQYNIAIMKEVLVYYRVHSQQISNTKNKKGESLMQLKAEEAIRRARKRRRV